MSVIPLETDSFDYDVLYNAAKSVVNVDGLLCEIGIRRGGSLKYIIDGVSSNKHKTIIAIDPYGNIDYASEETVFGKLDYTNDMKNESMPHIYDYVKNKNINLVFFNLEDTEFFKRFFDGVPVYNENKTIINNYSLVFFDGPHDLESIKTEINFFMSRINKDSVFVFDDIESYNHRIVHDYLLNNNFILLEVGLNNRKLSYKKV